MPNKWVNPPPREKATSDVSDQTSTAIGKEISFDTIKEQVGKKPVSKKLNEFLNKNISAIETIFYKSDYNTINKVKFKLEDLIYDLEDRTLIKINDDSANVKAFLIILADFYDRFCLRGAINIIVNY